MKPRYLFAIPLIVCILLFVSCVSMQQETPTNLPDIPSTIVKPPTVVKPVELPATTPKTIIQDMQPPDDRTWISPGKVQIANFYPGATAEWYIQVHNGNSKPATFAISYSVPDSLRDDYAAPPAEAESWVLIADTTPLILPKQTLEIPVILCMSNDAKNYPMKWEFWIRVRDVTQIGTVQTEMASRWLVHMR